VTDWRTHDTVYAERYTGLVNQNEAGSRDSSVFAHLDNLKAKLLLTHRMADDNNPVQELLAFDECASKRPNHSSS
jgi:dipeptidyl-peptidase-4